MAELFSVAEAAAIAEISPETIRTALEKKSVTPSHREKVGKAVRHQFSAGDVLFVKVMAEFPFPLSKQDKESLAQVLVSGNQTVARWSLRGADLVYRPGEKNVSFPCKHFQQMIARNLATYRWGKNRIVSSPEILGGEPVFQGTRISLAHVAELYRKGVSDQEISEDFPRLRSRDRAYARLVSRLGEKPGRPRKRLALQRGLETL